MEIGERLKKIRKMKGLTQQQVAEAIGVSASAYGNWEKGTFRMTDKSIIALSRFYHVSCDFILTGRRMREIKKEGEKKQ